MNRLLHDRWCVLAAALLAAGILIGCSSGNSAIAPIVSDALAAYRDGDIEKLSADVQQLETLGRNAERLSHVQRTAFDAAARLRALKALLWRRPEFREQSRLAYAQRLCARHSWADDISPQGDDQRSSTEQFLSSEAIGCEGATGVLTQWDYQLLLSNIVSYTLNRSDVNFELVRFGFIQPSPHDVAGFSPFTPVKIGPLTPIDTSKKR